MARTDVATGGSGRSTERSNSVGSSLDAFAERQLALAALTPEIRDSIDNATGMLRKLDSIFSQSTPSLHGGSWRRPQSAGATFSTQRARQTISSDVDLVEAYGSVLKLVQSLDGTIGEIPVIVRGHIPEEGEAPESSAVLLAKGAVKRALGEWRHAQRLKSELHRTISLSSSGAVDRSKNHECTRNMTRTVISRMNTWALELQGLLTRDLSCFSCSKSTRSPTSLSTDRLNGDVTLRNPLPVALRELRDTCQRMMKECRAARVAFRSMENELLVCGIATSPKRNGMKRAEVVVQRLEEWGCRLYRLLSG